MLTKQLIRDEGNVPYLYDDATGAAIVKGSTVVGYPTLGVGFMVDRDKGGRIPQPVTDFWLDYEINKITAVIEERLPEFSSLSAPRRAVLINVAFNTGINGLFNFKKMIQAVKVKDFDTAAIELLDSAAARQLTKRYTRLAAQLASGTWVMD